MNQRPPGYEPDELPDCSTPQHVSGLGYCRKERAYSSDGGCLSRKRLFEVIALRLQAVVAFTFLTGYYAYNLINNLREPRKIVFLPDYCVRFKF